MIVNEMQTPWSEALGRHLWEDSTFTFQGGRVRWDRIHHALGEAYARGEITLKQLEETLPFVFDQESRIREYLAADRPSSTLRLAWWYSIGYVIARRLCRR